MSKQAGTQGEQLAQRYLVRQGFRIVDLNYRFERGEIDIICYDGDVLVFCEVKTRYNDEYGDPEYTITQRKQRQIRKVALGYLYEREIVDVDCRFDFVGIRMKSGIPEINHIKNAF